MPQIVDGLKDPYGLNGGKVLSGSVTTKCDAFWYLPITDTQATVVLANFDSGSKLVSVPFTKGIGVYGFITEVTQSSGIAIVYSGSYMYPNQR